MRIGVVIPAHDAAPWIADALASLLAQTHSAWRAVVVDDGSTDATAEIAARFTADRRVLVIRQDRAGVSAARNRGLEHGLLRTPAPPPNPLPQGEGGQCGVPPPLAGRGRGRGEPSEDVDAILFLDADDWLAPDALARLAAALEAAPSAVAACGAAAFVAPDAKPDGRFAAPVLRTLLRRNGDILTRLLVRNLFANGGHVLIRADTLRAAGVFRPDLRYGEDWELLTRIAARGPFTTTASRHPVLFVRRRAEGAYLRLATDPASFAPCMAAVFGNPALLARFGADRLGLLRVQAEAENEWVTARALIRQHHPDGHTRLRRALAARPSLKRLAVTALAHLPQWASIAALSSVFASNSVNGKVAKKASAINMNTSL